MNALKILTFHSSCYCLSSRGNISTKEPTVLDTHPRCRCSSDAPCHGSVCFHHQFEINHVNVNWCTCWVVPAGSAGLCWVNGNCYTVGTLTPWEKLLEIIRILQLEDAEQRFGTVSACPTAYANLAILISGSYCLPVWHCMSLTDSLAMDLVCLWQKLRGVTFQESKYRKVLETVGCFFHVFLAMCTWEFSWLVVSSQPLAKLQALGWEGRAVPAGPPGSLLQRAPSGTAVSVQGIPSPLPAGKHPPGCCCPWPESHIQTKVQQEAGLAPGPEVLPD